MTADRIPLRNRGLFLLATLLHFFAAGAQTVFEYGSFILKRYTEAEGLVSPETTDTYKDTRGFLWVATFQGVSRFDGRNFENFARQNGLTESNVDLLGEDAGGQVFIKSVSNIYQYTGAKSNAFVKYPSTGKFINAACPAGKSEVWVAFDGEKGLHLFSPQKEVEALPTDDRVFKMLKRANGEIYVLQYSGKLSVLKDGKLATVYTVHPQQPYTNEGIRMNMDADGRLWTYGANNHFLYAHNGASIADSIAVPQDTRWWQWWVGKEKNVYYASDTGTVFQLKERRWQPVLTREQIRGSVYEIKEDGHGILWITTSGGLLKITRKQYKNVAARSADWFYTADAKGRYVLRSDSLLYTIPNAVKYFNQLQPEVVTNVYVTSQKEVWYCTESAVYFLSYGRPLQKLNTADTYEGAKAVFRFRRVLEDGKGGVFISSYHGIFHRQGNRLTYYFDKEGLVEGAIYTIAVDKNKIFYAAGIHVYALQNGTFVDVSKELHLPNEISRLTTDQEGNLWIVQEGTSTVRKVGWAGGRFFVTDSISLALNGLPFAANSATFDSQNNLWLCDRRSLYCYVKNTAGYKLSPVYFDEELSGSPLVYTDDSDRLQLLSHPLAGNYLRSYSPSNLLRLFRPKVPIVSLTGIWLFKEAFDWKEAGFEMDAFGLPLAPHLKHNQNFIRFSFTGLTKEFSRNIAYRYRLLGYDDDWSPATNSNEAEYTGLPSGSYSFEVQARSAGGEWSTPLQYRFTIGQAWYRTWWAYLLWFLLFLTLVSAFVYYRFQSLKGKEKTKQLLVEEQLKALRAQINPHFLQNTFAFLAHELYTAQNTKAVKAVDRLAVYLKDVLRFSDKAAITLEEELEFADEYLQMQQQLMSTPFTYEISVPEDLDVFDIQVPSMLLQPLIENALKYGIDIETGGAINITVTSQHPYVRCVISDTGRKTPVAIALPHSGSGKGLSLTKDRMELFYNGKRNKTQFYRAKNAGGGCDAILLIPID